jgi:hypothetical protein
MTATATGTTPQAAAPGRNRVGWIAAAVLAGAVLAVITVLAVMLAGQGSQIAALRGAVTAASQAAATAQHQAAAATSAATAAGKTRSAADNANLGVCVSTSYGAGSSVTYVSGVTLTSPAVAPGGAVSCSYGQFVPVTPQKAAPGA